MLLRKFLLICGSLVLWGCGDDAPYVPSEKEKSALKQDIEWFYTKQGCKLPSGMAELADSKMKSLNKLSHKADSIVYKGGVLHVYKSGEEVEIDSTTDVSYLKEAIYGQIFYEKAKDCFVFGRDSILTKEGELIFSETQFWDSAWHEFVYGRSVGPILKIPLTIVMKNGEVRNSLQWEDDSDEAKLFKNVFSLMNDTMSVWLAENNVTFAEDVSFEPAIVRVSQQGDVSYLFRLVGDKDELCERLISKQEECLGNFMRKQNDFSEIIVRVRMPIAGKVTELRF
ncbi:MAG: hypothetical protein U0L74_03770 [Paludibacteraceae bacterium]|nr:hypothetical protein [Paludibacteraceae bacterium]